jgi:O-antigen/teichoic acid export membrane protein
MIIAKIKRIFSTDLIKVSSLNAVSTLIRMLTGLISVKIVAAVIGPVGIALLGQLNNFSVIIQSISNGGIIAGVTKYVSEYSNSRKRNVLFLGTSFWITVVFSIICSIVLIIWSEYFAKIILHDEKYKYVFHVFGGTVILYALNALLISVINGFKEYRRYVIASILGSIVGLCFSVVLSLWYGIPGALIALVTYQSVVFFLTLGMVAKTKWFKWKTFICRFRKGIAVKLGHYSLMALASALTIPAGQLIVRNFIAKNTALSDAGLWEGMNRISLMYLTIITTSLSVYYLPRLAELKSSRELRNEIFSVYKLILPFLALVTIFIYFFRGLIINILFTKEFTSMQYLFGFQLIGDFLKIAGWVLGYLLIAKAMTRIYIIMELVNFFILILVCFFLVKSYGAVGAPIGYAIVYLVYFLVLIIIFRKLLFTRNA